MNTIYFLLAVVAFDPSALTTNPGVAKVDRILPGEKLIIHVLDWHYVGKKMFAECHKLEGEKLDKEYAKLLKEVAAVHASQLKILADVKEVFSEGLTDENLPGYREALRGITAYHKELKQFSPDDGPEAKKILDEHQITLFQYGAAGELALEGKLKELSAEGPEYDAARPMNGTVDPKLELAREEAIVKRILKHGKTSILVLGGGHDLTEIIRKHERWGYVRVKPKGYPNGQDEK